MKRTAAVQQRLLIAGLSMATTTAHAQSQLRFSDISDRCGIELAMLSGDTPSRHILEVDGGGVAIFDYDNDGDLDIFFANGATMSNTEQGPGSRLYANNGDATFVDVTDRVGISLQRWAMGVAVGDYNGDGFDDLYVTCFGKNVLLRNDRGNRFVDVGANAKVDDGRWGTSAAFGDIDGDGDLDLYVVNYLNFDPKNPPGRVGKQYKGVSVMVGPHGLTPQGDVLYENVGDGTFRDITKTSGVETEARGYGLVVRMIDADGDHRPEIFVGNDSTENYFFHNLGHGRFRNDGVISGVASNMEGSNQATMGIAFGDVDANGRADFFTTSFSSDTNTLHLNLDGEFFDDRTHQFGLGMVSRPFLSWGCGLYDFDGDGDEDLYIASGHVYPEAATHKIDSSYEQPPLLFEKVKAKRFARTTTAGKMFTSPIRGRAVAFGDLDGDGDVDIVQTTLNDRVRIWRNEAAGRSAPGRSAAGRSSGAGRSWIVVRLQQDGDNHSAYGSRVELQSPEGDRQVRWITGGGSYQSVDACEAYFATGTKAGKATARGTESKLEVTWPNGRITTHEGIKGGTRVVLNRDGRTDSTPLRSQP